jgi:double-stranded uracil-DNA glycosylase
VLSWAAQAGYLTSLDWYQSSHAIGRPRIYGNRLPADVPGLEKVRIEGPPEDCLTRYDPDILAKGLDVVFCGVNPASTAAAAGHNFSNANNRFWLVLNLAGFTDVRLRPQDERRLIEYRCGITAVVRRPTKSADEVSPEEFRKAGQGFELKMRRYAPRSIAFLGKRAISALVGMSDVPWGPLPSGYASTMAWVLPNPSGRNRNFTLEALVKAYSELRLALHQGADHVS